METLIINKRRELPRAKRLAWDAATIALWLGFLYLWKPLLHVLYRIITFKESPDTISDWIYDNIHSVTFENAVYTLIATPIVLFILSRLHRHVAPTEHLLYESTDYANYFHLSNAQLEECTNSQFITVYHNDHGHITRLDHQIAKNNE